MTEIKVLDRGFVRLEDRMGGDRAVLRAARVSYKSEAGDEERDRKLLAYLLAHQHGTPFEHAVFTFHVKLPIFVARQWIRHRTSSYNETSFRYREAPEEFYLPREWRKQDAKNKQGSIKNEKVGELEGSYYTADLETVCGQAVSVYRNMLAHGVARELARVVLPVTLYTEWYWTVNARALMNFLTLRCEAHAQYEIRQYAHALAQMMAQEMPWTFKAWLDALKPGPYEEMLDCFLAAK